MKSIHFRNALPGLTCLICLLVAIPAVAQEENKKKRQNNLKQSVMRPFRKLDLSEEQAAKINEIVEKHQEQLRELQTSANQILTSEQKQAQRSARKEAREKGLKGKKANQHVFAAMKLDEATIKKIQDTNQQLSDMRLKVQKEIFGLLNEQQKSQIKNRRIVGKKKKGKADKIDDQLS